MSKITEQGQLLAQDAIVTVFSIDATREGQGILRFAPEPVDGGPVKFNGYDYVAIPIEASGFQWNGKGKLPRPTLKVSAMSLAFVSLVISTDDLVGLPIRRIRTYRRHLDDGSDPDPLAIFPIDYYVFERKTRHNPTAGVIEFELAVEMDQQRRKIPGRQILRDTCTQIYRRWDATTQTFDYSQATCPYVGTASFNEAGGSVPDAGDSCGKRLSDCRLRFGEHGELPTRAFPGVGAVRRR